MRTQVMECHCGPMIVGLKRNTPSIRSVSERAAIIAAPMLGVGNRAILIGLIEMSPPQVESSI